MNPNPVRRRATPAILTCYRDNRARLLAELGKDARDRSTLNNIRAYYHIVRALEAHYDLSASPFPVGVDAVV